MLAKDEGLRTKDEIVANRTRKAVSLFFVLRPLYFVLDLSSECAGFARDPAKVEGPTLRVGARFDSWRGRLTMTLEPDGAATGCNPVQVGSTPTGVSKQ